MSDRAPRAERHPLPLALVVWTGLHILANPNLSHVVLFGLLGGFSALSMVLIDRRKRRQMGPEWDRLAQGTALALFAHPYFAGVSVLPNESLPMATLSLPEIQWLQTIARLQEAGWPLETLGDKAKIDSLTLKKDPSAAPVADITILQSLGAGQVETTLVQSIPEGIAVDRLLIGFNWVLVRAGNLCGIARSPDRGTEGARTIRPDGGFAGQSLRDLAQNLLSLDPLARALGLAAINTFWNRPDASYPSITETGGFAAIEPPGDGLVIIGGFRAAQRRLPQARVVEREPKPGDIPAHEATPALQAAKTLAITGQTLMNGSLAPLLQNVGPGPHKLLVGPSTPLCPLLLDHGLDELSAAVILDPDAAERFICESGTMIMRDEIARSAYLRKPTS